MAKEKKDTTPVTAKRYRPTENDQELLRVVESTKLGKDKRYRADAKDKGDDLPSIRIVEALSKMQMANHNDYRSIIELLPEIVRGMTILESAIMSPKDLLSPNLMYRMDSEIVEDCKAEVLQEIQNYLNANYSLNARLPVILREALHSKGAYVLSVIPRNTIDKAVKDGMTTVNMQNLTSLDSNHSVTKPLGLLGLPAEPYSGEAVNMQSLGTISAGALKDELFHIAGIPNLSITDNFNALKLPQAQAAVRRNTIGSMIRPKIGRRLDKSSPNMQSLGTDHVKALYKRRDYTKAESITLSTPTGMEEVYGRPMEANYPPESVIPVHVGGDVTKKEGIIVLCDESGTPVTAEAVESQFRSLQSSARIAEENNTSMSLDRVRSLMGMKGAKLGAKETLTDLREAFGRMVTNDLEKRLESGVYGGEVGLSAPDVMLDLAFKRVLCERKTRMIFIPEELSTYIAFDYDEYGIGRSRLESSKIIASMRAILLYSNMNAAMLNATPNLKLNITLDEDDPDPEATIEDTIAEFYALNSSRRPPGSSLNSHDITKSLQQMGVTISVTGNTRYPSTEVDLEDVGRNKAIVDRDLDDSLAKRIWLLMGLSPEAVDSSHDVEFARTIVSNNLFLAKLASELQSILLHHYSSHARKLIYSDGNLMTILIEKVAELSKLKSEEEILDLVNKLIEGFYLALPSTDIAKIESQQSALENYTQFVEMGIESYVNEEMLDGMIDGDITDGIRPAIRAYRDMLLRDFMRRENILPELQVLGAEDSDDIDLEERFKLHADPIVKSMTGLLEHFRKASRKFADDEEERIAKEEKKKRDEEDRIAEEERAAEEAANPPEETEETDETLTDEETETEVDEPATEEETGADAETETDVEETETPEDEAPADEPTDEGPSELDGLDNLSV